MSLKKIKILYTIPNFDTAGSGKVVYDLASNLDSSLFEVEVACSHSRGSFFKEVQKLGIPIHTMETTVKYRPYITLLFRLLPIIRFFRKNRFDIVHSWHWSSDWTEVLAARLVGVKWVYTKKAMNWGNVHWKLKCYLASFIITVNDDMKRFFRYKRNQKLIPFGLDTDHYGLASKYIRPDEMVKLITVANLVPIKGIETILKAVSHLSSYSVQLTIVGDDTTAYAKSLKDLCRNYGIDNQVIFTGKKLDVRPEMTSSDIYIISTLDPGEGMPMALVEAMSMGIPVLGSDVAGIRYVLKDFSNFLYDAGDSITLAQKIQEMMNLPKDEYKMVGEKLRAYCIQNFSKERFTSDHMSLYSSLANKQ